MCSNLLIHCPFDQHKNFDVNLSELQSIHFNDCSKLGVSKLCPESQIHPIFLLPEGQ